MDDRGRNRPDEVHVVAHKNNRSLVGSQRPDQRINTGHVEVGRRLVEQQKIRRVEQKFHEGQPAFFASAQDRDSFENIITPEQKCPENIPGGLFGNRTGNALHLGQNSPFQIQGLAAMLGKISDADIVTGGALAGFKRQIASEDFQQRGFASTIRADEHDPLAAFNPDMEILINHMVAVGLPHTFQAHHPLSTADRLRKLEMHCRLI